MDSAVTRREEMKERVSFIDAADILGAGARSARPATATPMMIEAISRGSVSAHLNLGIYRRISHSDSAPKNESSPERAQTDTMCSSMYSVLGLALAIVVSEHELRSPLHLGRLD